LELGCGGKDNWTFSGPWWDAGVAATAAQVAAAFESVASAGQHVNYWISDTEKGMSMWTIKANGHNDPGGECGPIRWRAIEADPRWPALYAELLDAGFVGDSAGAGPVADVLVDTVGNWMGGAIKENYLVWNALMSSRVQEYYTAAMWAPAATVFPNLLGSDYSGRYHNASWLVPDLNGHRITGYGHGGHFGTHQAQSHYGYIGQLRDKVGLVVDGRYTNTPFNAFRYDLQTHRTPILANPSNPTMPWICKKDWEGDAFFAGL